MPTPDKVRDLEKAAQRMGQAIVNGEIIGLVGDYDVDGVSSVTILRQFLEACGNSPMIHIPDRVKEGYGPSIEAVDKYVDAGVAVLVTLDCGIASLEVLAHAKASGLDTIVLDHHQVLPELPEAHAVVNPNRNDDLSGLGMLCAAGVTFMLIAALNRDLRENGWWNEQRPAPDVLQYLDLVALATVCDVVPLTGLNRAFVRQGLKVIASRGRVGMAALCDHAAIKRAPDAYTLGFVLGPRVNAAGRIGSALDAVELFIESDRGRANALAAKLESYNRERQGIELGVIDQAGFQAEKAIGEARKLPVLVVCGENWHPGVLGLAASRLKERFNIPSFALGFEKGSDLASGSARSIKGVDLGAAVQEAVALGIVEKGGGHAMAAGLSIRTDRLGDLRQFLEERLGPEVEQAQANRVLKIDAAVSASGANISLIDSFDMAGPFGSANPAPMFALPAHKIVYADIAGTDHVRCTLAADDGSRIKAIAFRVADSELGELLLTERNIPLHFAGRLTINDWGGRREPQLFIEDVARMR